MTKKPKTQTDANHSEDPERSRLLGLIEQLPSDAARSAFIDYALAAIRFNQLRQYLVQGSQPSGAPAKSGLNIVSEMMGSAHAGPIGPREQLLWMYDIVLNEDERPGFVNFCDATIGYQLTQVELGHRNWQEWHLSSDNGL
ncbi:hypothetical protein [Pyruvatibacter sp.]